MTITIKDILKTPNVKHCTSNNSILRDKIVIYIDDNLKLCRHIIQKT